MCKSDSSILGLVQIYTNKKTTSCIGHKKEKYDLKLTIVLLPKLILPQL